MGNHKRKPEPELNAPQTSTDNDSTISTSPSNPHSSNKTNGVTAGSVSKPKTTIKNRGKLKGVSAPESLVTVTSGVKADSVSESSKLKKE
ncbi:hypothetical protein ACFS7Z_08180 [Pontibacter toksunensis]|uniref:Uncharacterized protein n=1 Tax=Pontibacter toksunensis TaxID=1332631 RepID=A0ABW6BV92_9BACT